MGQNLTCALLYAKKGIAVFPKFAKTKTPVTKHGVHDATTNEKIIREWFEKTDHNVAIATGPLSQIVIVDVDVKNGKNGLASLAALEEQYGKLNTPYVQTTGSGGKQYIFRYVAPVGTVNNFMGFDGIDIRGKGASATLPPSLHESGMYYEWDGSPLWEIKNTKDIPPCPDFIVEYFKERQEVKEQRIKDRKEHPKEVSADQLESLLSQLKADRYDDRDSWLQVGMAIHEATNGSEEGLALWDDWSAQSSKWKPQECRKKWDGFYEGGGITVGTLIHMVQEDNPKPKNENTGNVKHTLSQYETNDAGFADMFCDINDGKVKYNVDRGKWLVWNNTYWKLDKLGTIMNIAKSVAEKYRVEVSSIEDDTKRAKLLKWATSIKNVTRMRNMLTLAEVHPNVATESNQWDADPFILGCENGIVDLTTGEFSENKPEYLVSKSTKVAYDKSAKAPRWEKFLEEVFEGNKDVINFIQKAVGYTLTGSIREQCFFMLIGTGRNGKSVFLKTIIKMLGDYAEISKFSVFERKQGNVNTTGIAKLAGCRITSATEANQGSAGFDEALIKNLTGGEKVADRFLYHEEFDFDPTFKIWLGVNHAPRVRDDSDGFWRRLRMINFPVKFDDAKDDKELDVKLMAELPGILNWAIEGCLKWQKEGLTAPAAIMNVVSEYRDSNDRLAPFIAECLVADTHGCVYADDVWKAYTHWTREMGLKMYQIVDTTSFHAQMTKRYGKMEIDGRKAYKGVSLIRIHEPEDQIITGFHAKEFQI